VNDVNTRRLYWCTSNVAYLAGTFVALISSFQAQLPNFLFASSERYLIQSLENVRRSTRPAKLAVDFSLVVVILGIIPAIILGSLNSKFCVLVYFWLDNIAVY